jgi:hypothetical protein
MTPKQMVARARILACLDVRRESDEKIRQLEKRIVELKAHRRALEEQLVEREAHWRALVDQYLRLKKRLEKL